MGCCGNGCGCSSGGSDGLVKFSGFVGTAEDGTPFVTFMADSGFGSDLLTTAVPIAYPVALDRTLKGLSVNIPQVTLSGSQSVLIELLKNGNAVPGFSVSYGLGDHGVKSNTTGRVSMEVGDTFTLRVTTVGFAGSEFVMAATVGVV